MRRQTINKRKVQNLKMELFTVKELNDVAVIVQYQVKISYRFAASDVDINRRENVAGG
jgi:hypothetical protein